MPKPPKVERTKLKQPLYQLYARPNLGVAALFKRAGLENKLKEATSCPFLVDWIQTHGDPHQVYFIYRDDRQQINKWVWSLERQWHTTAFEQIIVNRHIINSRKGSQCYVANPNH